MYTEIRRNCRGKGERERAQCSRDWRQGMCVLRVCWDVSNNTTPFAPFKSMECRSLHSKESVFWYIWTVDDCWVIQIGLEERWLWVIGIDRIKWVCLSCFFATWRSRQLTAVWPCTPLQLQKLCHTHITYTSTVPHVPYVPCTNCAMRAIYTEMERTLFALAHGKCFAEWTI